MNKSVKKRLIKIFELNLKLNVAKAIGRIKTSIIKLNIRKLLSALKCQKISANATSKKIFTKNIIRNFFMLYDDFFINIKPNIPRTIFANHIPSSGLSSALSANFSPPISDAQYNKKNSNDNPAAIPNPPLRTL